MQQEKVFQSTIDLFNKIETHLLTQNGRSVKEWVCQYRHEGLCCAVGILLTDEMYYPELEGASLEDFTALKHILEPLIGAKDSDEYNVNLKLLLRLQNIHDNFDVDCWKHELEQINLEFNLGE